MDNRPMYKAQEKAWMMAYLTYAPDGFILGAPEKADEALEHFNKKFYPSRYK